MDADSSYGGSDTAQDSTSATDNNSSIETNVPSSTTITHDHNNAHEEISTVYLNVEPSEDTNQFYHKNEVTLPVNYDETDAEIKINLPHYMSTANLNINDDNVTENNLEKMANTFKSTTKLHQQTPKTRKKTPPKTGFDNPGFEEEDDNNKSNKNGNVIRSSFGDNKKVNGDMNVLAFDTPNKTNEEQMTEAVNLELINLKPSGKDVVGPYENGKNGVSSIPTKKDNDVEMNNPYDEYFVPVNEHRKYMR